MSYWVVTVEMWHDSGTLSDWLLRSKDCNGAGLWHLRNDAPARFPNLALARKAVKAFVKQEHDPPLDDGYGTVIYATQEVDNDAKAERLAEMEFEAKLWEQDKVEIVRTRRYYVLWRSRPFKKSRYADPHWRETAERIVEDE